VLLSITDRTRDNGRRFFVYLRIPLEDRTGGTPIPSFFAMKPAPSLGNYFSFLTFLVDRYTVCSVFAALRAVIVNFSGMFHSFHEIEKFLHILSILKILISAVRTVLDAS
jgi:hypothetical protein